MRIAATPASAKPVLQRVGHYLNTHRAHLQYRQFKKLGLPIGSDMVESACKWLIEQGFKGSGMRWSKPGFNHLLHLPLAWVMGASIPYLQTTHSPPISTPPTNRCARFAH